MKAFCASQYGAMDYFSIREIAKPAPKENQVLVKVHAVSINDWDWADLGRITRGHWLARLGFGWSKPKKIIGSDIELFESRQVSQLSDAPGSYRAAGP
jgi:NADPH:quinone reductase-like Zn-dependent oxidoreductase